jgi:phosphate transport system substrate-binding protein
MKISRFGLFFLFMFSLVGNIFAGDIVVKGSTTVFPIAQACAEEFMDRDSSVNISIQGGGSGFGIASVIDGAVDIGNASRPAKDKEITEAARKGVDLKANIVGMDGIAVVVHPSNRINGLTKQELKDIYTGNISHWSEIGGSGGQIVVVSRDSASGTYEAFMTLALDKARLRQDSLRQASNRAVVTTVATTPGAIGYVGLGYLSSEIKAVTINAVLPSKETVVSAQYELSRPLFMYTNGKPKGRTKDFMDFILSRRGQEIVERQGFVGIK